MIIDIVIFYEYLYNMIDFLERQQFFWLLKPKVKKR